MSRPNLRRGTAVGASALALVAPMALTAAAAAPAVAALPTSSFTSFGSPLNVGGPRAISNWGGYIAIRGAGTFTSAQASWKIAKVTCNSNALFAPWVGIDGDGNNTVEQTGAATQCSGGKATYAAWYEMYPSPPVYYNDPISVGDEFTASVTVSGSSFTLKISDLTKKWTESVTKTSASAEKSTAEAVIEGPGGYPGITSQQFTNVMFNGQSLKSFHPTESDTQSGSATVYTATKIKHGTDFKMKPVK